MFCKGIIVPVDFGQAEDAGAGRVPAALAGEAPEHDRISHRLERRLLEDGLARALNVHAVNGSLRPQQAFRIGQGLVDAAPDRVRRGDGFTAIAWFVDLQAIPLCVTDNLDEFDFCLPPEGIEYAKNLVPSEVRVLVNVDLLGVLPLWLFW